MITSRKERDEEWNKRKRHLLTLALDDIEKGATIMKAAARLGYSSGWLRGHIVGFDKTDPLRIRYERLQTRNFVARTARKNIERIVKTMETKRVYARPACRMLGIPSERFYTWMRLHRDDPLYARYLEMKKHLPHWNKMK